MGAACIKRIPCDPFRLDDKVCSVCQLAHDQEQNAKINHRAWMSSMMDFLRFKGLERDFTDWSGGWEYPGKEPTNLMELENLQLRSALTAIRDRIWRDGETYDERIGDLKWLAREALERSAHPVGWMGDISGTPYGPSDR